MYRIYIVEDDTAIAQSIKKYLCSWGYEVQCAENFQEILREFTEFSPHLVLMDLSLPFYNGFHWCREIRRQSTVPVMFLSSASENMNIVLAMDMGGDDFIAKPFDVTVLTAKIGALLRRTYDMAEHKNTELLEYGDAVLNCRSRTVSYREQTAELSKNEYGILLALMEQKGGIVSRDELMRRLWATDQFVDENTLTVNVTRLRKKLEELGLTDFITTKKGVGYKVK